TPSRYVNAYNQIYDAIHAVAPSERIAPAASGTYGPPDTANGIPGYIDYWTQVIGAIPASKIQALIVHTYTHGSSPALITDTPKSPDPPYQNYYFNFFAYRDYMAAIPAGLRGLPVLITETGQTAAWFNSNSGWVRNAYGEINAWNQANSQKIRALALFRWN